MVRAKRRGSRRNRVSRGSHISFISFLKTPLFVVVLVIISLAVAILFERRGDIFTFIAGAIIIFIWILYLWWLILGSIVHVGYQRIKRTLKVK